MQVAGDASGLHVLLTSGELDLSVPRRGLEDSAAGPAAVQERREDKDGRGQGGELRQSAGSPGAGLRPGDWAGGVWLQLNEGQYMRLKTQGDLVGGKQRS